MQIPVSMSAISGKPEVSLLHPLGPIGSRTKVDDGTGGGCLSPISYLCGDKNIRCLTVLNHPSYAD